eukprot:4043212-Prymnesium_polylepis.1
MIGCAFRARVPVRPITALWRHFCPNPPGVHHGLPCDHAWFQRRVAVYRLASKDSFETCDFTGAQLLLSGSEYVLSESFLTEGSNYFASQDECLAGLKFEASSAEYFNYAGFSWPVNAPGRRTAPHSPLSLPARGTFLLHPLSASFVCVTGGCVFAFYGDANCHTTPLLTVNTTGTVTGLQLSQEPLAMMLAGANCYANVWDNGQMSGTASTLEPGGEALTGASSKAVASHQQGCDAFPFTGVTTVSLQVSTGNHLYAQGSAKTSTSCTCPDGQTYAVQSQCSKNANGVDLRTNWYEDDHQKCTYGTSAGTSTADTAC